MSIKIGILTTNTPHHTYFVKEILKHYDDLKVFSETDNIKSQSFKTFHPFEKKRREYEITKWFNGKKTNLDDIVDTKNFSSLNNNSAIREIKKYNPDLIIVFGTRPLKPKVLEINPHNIFNLHGGDPERYRGLDSHLWAIYHDDFKALLTTLHRMAPKLDTGEIVLQSSIPIKRNLPLHCLQSMNTNICLKLTVSAINMFHMYGEIFSRPQKKLGRYYSAMPSDLKTICVKKFKNFIKNKK